MTYRRKMAKITTKVVRQLTLTLTEAEGRWLREALQNPIDPSESPEDNHIREELFKGLDRALRQSPHG